MKTSGVMGYLYEPKLSLKQAKTYLTEKKIIESQAKIDKAYAEQATATRAQALKEAKAAVEMNKHHAFRVAKHEESIELDKRIQDKTNELYRISVQIDTLTQNRIEIAGDLQHYADPRYIGRIERSIDKLQKDREDRRYELVLLEEQKEQAPDAIEELPNPFALQSPEPMTQTSNRFVAIAPTRAVEIEEEYFTPEDEEYDYVRNRCQDRIKILEKRLTNVLVNDRKKIEIRAMLKNLKAWSNTGQLPFDAENRSTKDPIRLAFEYYAKDM